ncbi:phage head closure protein [Azospirillum sp.]|uniref:phage head closure protein n=1 Tax=Azospirillum sp. TaxID=34012 RepID=UPI003D757945
MSAGKLDQRIRIEQRSRVEDEGGGAVEGWALLAEVWAEQWPVSGRERAEAQQVQASAMVRFRIRRRTDVSADMRVIWLSRAHNIRHVADAGPREPFVILDCEAGVAL